MANRKTTGKKGRKPRAKNKVLEQIVSHPVLENPDNYILSSIKRN
jgi:hypothetical protein